MAVRKPATKKSVTIDTDVLERLRPARKRNLSATVNESLELLAALDAQQSLIDDWQQKHGRFTEAELRPYLEAAVRAQVMNAGRVRATVRARPPDRKRHSVRRKPV